MISPRSSARMILQPQKLAILAIISAVVFAGLQTPGTAAGISSPPSVPRKPLVLKPQTPQLDLSNEPDSGDVFDQAVKEYAAGHLPAAEKLFEKTIYLDPSNADAYYNLGAIKEWKNDWMAALNQYKAAQRLRPDDKEIADAVRGVQYKIKNRTAIEAQLEQQKKEHELATHSRLARECFAQQNYADAVVHLNYLVQIMPDDPKIQFALGQSLRALKSYEWAAYRLKMAIYLDSENDLYHKTLIDLDKELQEVTAQAYTETADRMLAQTDNTQMADVGLKDEEY